MSVEHIICCLPRESLRGGTCCTHINFQFSSSVGNRNANARAAHRRQSVSCQLSAVSFALSSQLSDSVSCQLSVCQSDV